MSKVVVISGHPELEKSNANEIILEALVNSELDVDIRRLDELYPDYKIDVEAEQAALLKAELVVLQFPFFWYSVPALLKKWLDDTFTYDFAYGSKGDKLKGKGLILSLTVGGPEEAYKPLGYNHFRMEELLKPLEQTAYLAEMEYHQPIYSHSMVYIPNIYNTLEAVEQRAKEHSEQLIQSLSAKLGSPELKIKQFANEWFAQFDRLPESDAYLLSFLAEDIVFKMPEGDFSGHAGFRDWYQIARTTFKPNCQHLVEQMEISVDGHYAELQLRIRLKAETYEDSSFKGDSINLLVNETWKVEIGQEGGIIIQEYIVSPVDG